MSEEANAVILTLIALQGLFSSPNVDYGSVDEAIAAIKTQVEGIEAARATHTEKLNLFIARSNQYRVALVDAVVILNSVREVASSAAPICSNPSTQAQLGICLEQLKNEEVLMRRAQDALTSAASLAKSIQPASTGDRLGNAAAARAVEVQRLREDVVTQRRRIVRQLVGSSLKAEDVGAYCNNVEKAAWTAIKEAPEVIRSSVARQSVGSLDASDAQIGALMSVIEWFGDKCSLPAKMLSGLEAARAAYGGAGSAAAGLSADRRLSMARGRCLGIDSARRPNEILACDFSAVSPEVAASLDRLSE